MSVGSPKHVFTATRAQLGRKVQRLTEKAQCKLTNSPYNLPSVRLGALPKARSPPKSHPERSLKRLDLQSYMSASALRLEARRGVAGRICASHRPLSGLRKARGTRERFSLLLRSSIGDLPGAAHLNISLWFSLVSEPASEVLARAMERFRRGREYATCRVRLFSVLVADVGMASSKQPTLLLPTACSVAI